MTDRQRILDAFGVTEGDLAEFADLDAATEAAHAEREHFEQHVLPERIAAVEADLSDQLPDGLSVRFGPVICRRRIPLGDVLGADCPDCGHNNLLHSTSQPCIGCTLLAR